MEKKRLRGANFTQEEKNLVLKLVNKYKFIIGNKKTTAVVIKEKRNTWRKIEEEFNAASPCRVFRSWDNLQNCYNNQKREFYRNAGGAHVVDASKLVFFHTDNNSSQEVKEEVDYDPVDIEVDKINNIEEAEQNFANLTAQIENREIPSSSWENSAPTCTTPLNPVLQLDHGNHNKQKSTRASETYNDLLEKRLAIANLEHTRLQRALKTEEDEANLRKESLLLDIAIKKQTLKNLREKNNLV